MSWSQALRRPRVESDRRPADNAFAGDMAVLRLLASIPDRYTSSHALGGCAAMQSVYRLRNSYGADIIQTVTGLGYRITRRGLEIARGLDAHRQEVAA